MKLEGIYNNGIWLASKMYFLYDGNIRNKKKEDFIVKFKGVRESVFEEEI